MATVKTYQGAIRTVTEEPEPVVPTKPAKRD